MKTNDDHCTASNLLMDPNLSRRRVIGSMAMGTLGAAVSVVSHRTGAQAQTQPQIVGANDRIRVAVMGVNGRGSWLAKTFAADSRAEVVALCDVDSRVGGVLADSFSKDGRNVPRLESDFRRLLDDTTIDVLVVATPNHWHAPATILACNAGKHVYVEKPCSHTPEEGELAVNAARKHNCIVTMGSQRRSYPGLREAIERLHAGVIGPVRYARTWYTAQRGSIGVAPSTDAPAWLDWDLWQGPAPHRPFRANIVHYNWHWNWHWGDGELGNNGVHCLDVARWGMDVSFPTRVTSSGGRYRFHDDQETPDTMMVSYEFPENKMISWEGLSCSPRGPDGTGFGICFLGDNGSLTIGGGGDYKIFDASNKELESPQHKGGDLHIANFLDCVASGALPHADIEEAHKSTLLCQLGNISYRAGRSLSTRATDGHIENDPEAAALWRREYRDQWQPKVT